MDDSTLRFPATFTGDVIAPDHAAYDDARRVWNAVFDLRPAIIARPRTTADVATVIRFARDHDLELAVRCGGHSPAGHSTSDGGLVLDLSLMRGVTVDPATKTARANGGALLGELDVAAQAHGLVCPTGVVGHTGVAGLTLGGGVGRLQRNFGLTIDNLQAVWLVTADGRVVRASQTEEPDLFWGIRGAGWNFGVVTAFEFGLHPFGPEIHRGVRVYPASAAREVWQVFEAYAATAPDAVSMIYGISPAGEHGEGDVGAASGDPVVIISYNHSGRAEDVERDTAGLSTGPEPLSVSGSSQNFLDIQSAHDLIHGWGGRSYIQGLYADIVRPAALESIVDHMAAGPDGGGAFSVTAMGGAIARLDDDAMAFSGRAARFDVSADASWKGPESDASARQWVAEAMAPFEPDAVEGRYANENSEVGPAATRRIYGDAKVTRLASLKRTWDPDNVFRRNHNVEPATT